MVPYEWQPGDRWFKRERRRGFAAPFRRMRPGYFVLKAEEATRIDAEIAPRARIHRANNKEFGRISLRRTVVRTYLLNSGEPVRIVSMGGIADTWSEVSPPFLIIDRGF